MSMESQNITPPRMNRVFFLDLTDGQAVKSRSNTVIRLLEIGILSHFSSFFLNSKHLQLILLGGHLAF